MKTCVILSRRVNLQSQSLKKSLKGFIFRQSAGLHKREAQRFSKKFLDIFLKMSEEFLVENFAKYL